MSLLDDSNHVYIPLVDLNEGLMTGTITKACLVGTHNFLFVVPFSAVNVLGENVESSRFTIGESSPEKMVESLLGNADMTVEELEAILTETLSEDETRRIFPIAELEKFNVKTGMFSGGMFLKMPGEARKAANVRGKNHKIALKNFYQNQLKK